MKTLQRSLFAIASGFLIGEAQTAHPWLALFCLTPLIIALMAPTLDDQGKPGDPPKARHAALLGALAYATASTYGWGIGQYGWTIYMAGMIYLSLGGALFGLLAAPVVRAPDRSIRVLGLTGAWVMVEFSRTLTWGSYPILVGAGLGEYPVLAQLASVGGPWLLGAFVAALAAMLAESFEAWLLRDHPFLPRGRGADWLVGALTLLVAVSLGGAARLTLADPTGAVLWDAQEAPTPPPAPYLTVSALQGGVPTWYYRRAGLISRLQQAIDANYDQLLGQALDARPWGKEPGWVILPEASLNRELPRDAKALERLPLLSQRRFPEHTTVLLGTTTTLSPPDPDYPAATRENIMVALEPDAQGKLQWGDSVAKRRLVPIAEARYRPQDSWRLLQAGELRAGVMVCYESLYPDIAAAFHKADVLVVGANDAGLRWSQAPRIHARLGILRAVETGRSLIHAGQAGYTFLVDPYGRRTPELDLFERGAMTGAVTLKTVPTLYNVLGRSWVVVAAAIWAFSLFLSRRITRNREA